MTSSAQQLKISLPTRLLIIIIFTGMSLHLIVNPDVKVMQDVKTAFYSFMFVIFAIVMFINSFRLLKAQADLFFKVINLGTMASALLFITAIALKLVI